MIENTSVVSVQVTNKTVNKWTNFRDLPAGFFVCYGYRTTDSTFKVYSEEPILCSKRGDVVTIYSNSNMLSHMDSNSEYLNPTFPKHVKIEVQV